jgi:hypothetical protein
MKAVKTVMLGVGAFLSLGLLTAEQAHSGKQSGLTTCSLTTLKGLYMFAQSGYVTISGSLVPQGVTGKAVFNGNGTFNSLATISIGGTIVPDDAAPGTYTLNSDCTGTVTVLMTAPTPDVHLDIFVAPDGDEIFTIQTDPGNVLSGTERRVAP